MPSIDELIAALEDLPEQIVIVGGIAAHLHAIGDVTDPEWPLSIEALASIRRTTNDIDVVVLGDVKISPRGRVPIDRLPGKRIEDGPVTSTSPWYPMSDRHTITVEVGRARVRVVSPSLFVIYKAIAYNRRHFERDVADIAATAVRAAAGCGATPEALADEITELLPHIPGADDELRRVATRYATNDDLGVTAFLKVVRAAVSVSEAAFADAEDDLRDMIGFAARRLLSRWVQ